MYIGALSKVETAMCLYNGVKLPELPVVPSGYEHTYITDSIIGTRLYFTDTPLNITFIPADETSSGEDSVNGVHSADLVNYVLYTLSDDGCAWTYKGPNSWKFRNVYKPIWANTGMEKYYYHYDESTKTGSYEATGTIGLAASDPVPLCSYNGVELPELPEGYQFATLKQNDTDGFFSGGKVAVLYLSNQPITKTGSGITSGKLVLSGRYKLYLLVNDLKLVDILGGSYNSISEVNKWTLVETGENKKPMIGGYDYDWSNHDILDDDDDVYLPRSESQPVSIFSESEVARKVSSVYIGVDGVARKVKKAYIGVDGKARLCWEAGGETEDVPTAFLYDDGTMVFQNHGTPDPTKTILQSFTGWEDTTDMGYWKMPWYPYKDSIISVDISAVYPVTMGNWFRFSYNLSSALLPHGMTEIPDHMFAECAALDAIAIPGTVRRIGWGAFDSTGLAEIVLPQGLTYIGSDAFRETPLASISIPDTVETLGQSAFFKCQNLTTAKIDAKYIGTSCFNKCPNLTNITFGGGVETIRKWAFIGAGLTSVVIPASVKMIGTECFRECVNLTRVTFEDPNGWWYGKEDATSGTSIDLSDPRKNAQWLTTEDTNNNRFLYKG